MIHKSKNIKGLRYKSYTTLFDRCVTPILDYCSGVWGYKSFVKIDTVQNRAMRYFMGVHKFAPNLSVIGDMGWWPSTIRHKIDMLKLWNKLIHMDDMRLMKSVFIWDYNNPYNSWCKDIKHIFQEINETVYYDDLLSCNINDIKDILRKSYSEKWKKECLNVSKLRSYVQFKKEFGTES